MSLYVFRFVFACDHVFICGFWMQGQVGEGDGDDSEEEEEVAEDSGAKGKEGEKAVVEPKKTK